MRLERERRMESLSVWRLVIFCCFFCVSDCYVKSVYDTLADLNCSKFRGVIDRMSEGQRKTYQHREGSDVTITLFAFNDTAFDAAPASDRSRILSLNQIDVDDYVKSLTVAAEVGINSIEPNSKRVPLAATYHIYFHRRTIEGQASYFVNGAEIVGSETRAVKGVIFLLDRLLLPTAGQRAYSYLRAPEDRPGKEPFKFESRVLQPKAGNSLTAPMEGPDDITIFVPTDATITSIPHNQLNSLLGNAGEFDRVIKQHMILKKVVYPSYIQSNDKEVSLQGSEIVFQRDIYGRAYVTSGGVTAEITGHVTVTNGVVVWVEEMLGLQYRNAWNLLQRYSNGSEFRNLVQRSGSAVSPTVLQSTSGVTLFVPSNAAMEFVRQLPGVDNFQNSTLSNMVQQLSILASGHVMSLGNVTNDFNSPKTVPSQHSGSKILVYREGQDLWVEGGYVRAKVILPDVVATNGFVHYLDDVMGVPSRDLPATIDCEDRLLMTSHYLNVTGLGSFTRDHAIRTATRPCPDSLYRRHFRDKVKATVTPGKLPALDACAAGKPRCLFTLFVVNGSAMESFLQRPLGQKLLSDPPRLQYIFRRHLVFNNTLYLDKLRLGSHYFKTHTGEDFHLEKLRGHRRDADYTVGFRDLRVKVIHADIGATNGVIHIVDNLVVREQDLTLDISSARVVQASVCLALALAFSVVLGLV